MAGVKRIDIFPKKIREDNDSKYHEKDPGPQMQTGIQPRLIPGSQ